MDRQTRRRGYSPVTAILILASLVLGIFLFCSSSWGQGIAEEYIAPIAEKVMNLILPTSTPETKEAMGVTEMSSPEPSATPTAITVDWELPESSWYILEMGVYTDSQQASQESEKLQSMGAAGYMYTDIEGHIRLLAAGYREQESLLQVQKQVTESGFTASPYNFHLAGLKCRLTGEKEDVSAIEQALDTACDLPSLLTDYALRFDRENLTVQVAREQINGWLETLAEAESTLLLYRDAAPLEAFCAYMAEAKSLLSTFLQKDATISQTECAASLKYTQIAVLVAYKTLTEGLVT